MERIVRENRLDAEHGGIGAFSFPGGFGLEGLDHPRDAGAIVFGPQPALLVTRDTGVRATGVRATDAAVAASLFGETSRDLLDRGVVEMAKGLSG